MGLAADVLDSRAAVFSAISNAVSIVSSTALTTIWSWACFCAPVTKPPAAMAAPVLVNVKPVCKHCGTDVKMELVHFNKNGVDRDEWKCQECGKWHYDKR